MERRKVLVFTLVLLLGLTTYETFAWSAFERPLPAFHIISKLPDFIVAGSPYNTTVRFVNPKSETLLMNVLLEISGQGLSVGFGEFQLEGMLESWNRKPFEHYSYSLSFNEINGGTFLSIGVVKERFNYLTLRISSVPNLYPGTYTYNLTGTLFKTETSQAEKLAKAVEYLNQQFNPEIQLCREAPTVAPNTYWLVSDNLWASKALEKYTPQLSKIIRSKIIELAETYNLPKDTQGLPVSFKHEAVIGDTVNTPFNVTISYMLHSNDYTLKTDIANGTAVMEDWQKYADLLLYAALSKHWEGEDAEALTLFNMAKSMWDGVGINDTATRADGTYSTYKLALLLYTSKILNQKLNFEEELTATIFRMQNEETGGIITDYYPNGKPVEYADTNTETTSITIIALTK